MLNNLYLANSQSKLNDHGFDTKEYKILRAWTESEKPEKPHSKKNYQVYANACRNSPAWKNARFDNFGLVGQGESRDYCDKWVSWGCDNIKEHPQKKHYAQHEQKKCKRSECPLCFESWINRQASRTAHRMEHFVKDKRFNFRHVILSPEKDKASKMSYNQLKTSLNFALKILNIKTCIVVFHSHRFLDSKKEIPIVSPHFHLLVYGRITNTTEFYNKISKTRLTWIIKNKGDLKNPVDVFGCVRYLLSHAGVRHRTHSVRYFGDISYRSQFAKEYRKVRKEIEAIQSHYCPYCELPLTIFRIKRPIPIDFVGLCEPDCYERIDYDDDMKIPFYDMVKDNKEQYVEQELYSFEEKLALKTSQYNRFKLWHVRLSQKYLTSRNCMKIENFIT